MADYDPDNIFAKILRGDLPSHTIYEDESVVAIMDAMPQADGHALVIPRAPSRNLLDMDEATIAPLFAAVQTVARGVKTALGADGVTITQFNEAPAGQSVFHAHVHVIPRWTDVPLKPHTGKMEAPEALAALAEKIRVALAAD
ncbi:HIT family protein [Methylopila turkensis]|uniref:Hydrolase n=1 Tax=Methylopila turkensis TaxID=1437816 RepID=A0A9W6JQN4_9HYPH|nr:HIT family protein [Methylopila turkensis]GLK80796.1 hydrolase [Methylopila turkensis]